MRILDTHLHLIYQDKLSYPWLADAGALNKQWTVEDYFAMALPLCVEAALHMEVDVAEADIVAETEFVSTLHPRVIGAIAGARPEHADFPAQLEKLAAISATKGLRRILHSVPDDVSQTETFRQNVRLIGAKGLNFDLCVRADQLPIGTELVDAAPDTQFILDHCGVPKVAEGEMEPWRGYITEIAKRPNIAAKVSGIVAYAKPDWTAEDLRPYVEHIIESFGWDRVVWGSDHPVCTLTANVTRWVEATRTIIAGASEVEQSKLLHANAERLYRI